MGEGDHAAQREVARLRRRLAVQQAPLLPAHYSGLADEWYCVMAVCGAPPVAESHAVAAPVVGKRQRTEEASEADGEEEEDEGETPSSTASTRRTAVYHTTDPIGYVCKLNGDPLLPFDGDAVDWYTSQRQRAAHKRHRNRQCGLAASEARPATTPSSALPGSNAAAASTSKRKPTSHSGASRYRIVFVIGPLPSRSSAIIVQTLLLWRSRGLVPRTAWGKLIAEHFYAHFWVNYEEVFPMKHHTIVHTDLGEVYIKESTAQCGADMD